MRRTDPAGGTGDMVRRAARWHAPRPSDEGLRDLAELLLDITRDNALLARVVHEFGAWSRYATPATATNDMIAHMSERATGARRRLPLLVDKACVIPMPGLPPDGRTLPGAAELPSLRAEPTFMGMPDTLTPVYWTADMARRLPEDGNRYEVVYGELLVTPAPRLWHQQLVGRLHVALAKYLEVHRAGLVLTSPADISWGRDVLVQPDVFVVPVEQARALEWSAIRDLLLVAEVLSPSTPRHDRFTKRRRYQEARVPLYWIVDGDARQVEVWTPDDAFPRLEQDRLVWQPEGAGAPFTLSLQELFRAIE